MASSPEAARIKAACEAQWRAPGLASVDSRTIWTGSADQLQAKAGQRISIDIGARAKAFIASVRSHWGPAAPAYVGRQQMGPKKAE